MPNLWTETFRTKDQTTLNHVAKSGKFYIKTIYHDTGEVCVSRYPSVSYWERLMSAHNSGAKAKTVWRD